MSDSSTNRDDFPAAVRRLLEQQAASRCCNPGCNQSTRASSYDGTKSISIGTAAHIHAAAPGGARYDASMTSEQRKAAENGIWMCRSCATLIDTDAAGFPADTITKWKAKALAARRDELVAPNRPVAPSQNPEPTEVLRLDRKRYEEFVAELPTTGTVIDGIRRFDGEDLYRTETFYPLEDAVSKWTAPEAAFSNMKVQAALIHFTKAASAFLHGLAYETYRASSGFHGVPKEWRFDQPERYKKAAQGLNTLAEDARSAHVEFIETARRELEV